MTEISRATVDQAKRLFEIQCEAIRIGCASSYPPEVIAIWNKGHSAEGMARVIAETDIYVLQDHNVIRGFIDIGDSEVLGLFVQPDDQRKGYGTELFRFAVSKIGNRPIIVKATLNSVPFYLKLGCRKVATALVRRHDHDIYVERMELP
jgi:GNAT superfamily N-acetyltransferase